MIVCALVVAAHAPGSGLAVRAVVDVLADEVGHRRGVDEQDGLAAHGLRVLRVALVVVVRVLGEGRVVLIKEDVGHGRDRLEALELVLDACVGVARHVSIVQS